MTKAIQHTKTVCAVLTNQFVGLVINYLKKNKEAGVTVTEIQNALNFEQPVTSLHLSKLRQYHFVVTERSGKYVKYKLSEKYFETVEKLNALWEKPTPQKQSSEN